MANETKKIEFDSNGGNLWINVEMFGIYYVTYVYQLWSAIATEPPILTNPLKHGSNNIPHDDYYQVINDFTPNQPLAYYDQRTIDVRFWIKKGSEDNGYNLKVTLFQGATFATAVAIDSDSVSGKLDTSSIKEEFITIQLIKK